MDRHIQEHRDSMKLDGFKRKRGSKVDWVQNEEVGLGGGGGRVTLIKIQWMKFSKNYKSRYLHSKTYPYARSNAVLQSPHQCSFFSQLKQYRKRQQATIQRHTGYCVCGP